jgi:hypothetical protein
VKRRFLQFSLRGLLALTVLVCLFLGARHLLKTYGNQIEAIGKSRIKGRYIRVLGPTQHHLVVAARFANDDDDLVRWTHEAKVDRSWLCCYDFDWELGPQPFDDRLTFDLCQWDETKLAVIKSNAIKDQPHPQLPLALLVSILVVGAFFGGIRFERERRRREDAKTQNLLEEAAE